MNKKIVFFILIIVISLLINARTVKVGITDTPPLVFMENGKVSGFFIDIIEYIAAKEKWALEYKSGTLEECIDMLSNGEIDLLADIGYSLKRDSIMDFSLENVTITWAAFYTAHGYNISDYNDLHDKTIAVEKEDCFIYDKDLGLEHVLQSLGIDFRMKVYDDYESVLNAVREDSADVGIVNKMFGEWNVEGKRLHASDLIFSPVSLRFAAAEGKNPELLKTIDKYLHELKKDRGSIYYKSYKRYIDSPETYLPTWLIALIYSVIAFLITIFLLFFHRSRAKMAIVEDSRRKTVVRLGRMNETMYEILDMIPVGIVCLDNKYETIYVNFHAREMFFDRRIRTFDASKLFFKKNGRKLSPEESPFNLLIDHNQELMAEEFEIEFHEMTKRVLINGRHFFDPTKNETFGLFTFEEVPVSTANH